MSGLVRTASTSLAALACVEVPSSPPCCPTLERENRPIRVGRRSTALEVGEGPTLGRMRLVVVVGPISLFNF